LILKGYFALFPILATREKNSGQEPFAQQESSRESACLRQASSSSHTKQLYYSDGSGKNKPKVFDDFYLQPFSLDATARIGWGPLNLYANYSLVQMFRAGKGPELYPFSIGLIMPFS